MFPDGKYYNTADPTDYGSMEASYASTGPVRYSLCREDGEEYTGAVRAADAPAEAEPWIDTSDTPHVLRRKSAATGEWIPVETVFTRLSFISEGELPGLFGKLDGVTISGAAVESVNGEQILHTVGGGEGEADFLVVTGLLDEAQTQTTG